MGHDKPHQRFPVLPAATYLVGASPIGFFLKEIPGFDLPRKIYGDINKKVVRILSTFHDRPKTTGVLLSGEKGSGKTLLTKLISNKAIDQGMPVLVINTALSGDGFNLFIQSIAQPCVVLFDEFEKVYDKDAQLELLTLFDGIFTTKKLILLTSNDYFSINNHFQNRPGRIYYNLEFKGLDTDFILEYGKDNLKNQEHLANLGIVASMINPISFDILQSIIEESNRYNESPVTTLDILNVKASSYSKTFVVELKLFNAELAHLDGNEVSVNPFKRFVLEYYKKMPKNAEYPDGKEYTETMVQPDSLIKFDGLNGTYEYKTDEYYLKLTRKPLDHRNNFEKYGHLADGYND